MAAAKQAFRLATVVLAGAALVGCSVRVNKDDNGKEKDVSIHTPFGGMQVHKDGHGAVDTGLPVYPGATLEADKGDDDKSVDLQMGFGPWQMRVQVASYLSGDSREKVQAFYKKALGQYGDVLTCRGDQAEGQPVRTRQGLSCKDKNAGEHVHMSNDADLELKAGSESKQHLVAFDNKFEPKTHFALIGLDLPKDMGGAGHDRDSRDSKDSKDSKEKDAEE